MTKLLFIWSPQFLLLIVFSVVVMMLDAELGKQAVLKAHSEDAVVIQGISSAHSSTIFWNHVRAS